MKARMFKGKVGGGGEDTETHTGRRRCVAGDGAVFRWCKISTLWTKIPVSDTIELTVTTITAKQEYTLKRTIN